MIPGLITQPSDFTSFASDEIEQSIGSRFERIVDRHPDRIAVGGDALALSYEGLNRLANRIAHGIAGVGTPPGALCVGIFLEKGALNLAAILGTLKAGHAYVPIDPGFPASRNDHIIADSGAGLVLTNHSNLAAAQQLAAGRACVLNIETLPAGTPDTNPGIPVPPDALAYLIYTSGSTGKPKGVMQNHRNALHGCMRRTNLQKVAPSDRMTLFYSTSVMGSVYCIFGALLNGAALFPYDIREDGLDALAGWLRRQRITIYHSVASVFREFSPGPREPEEPYSVRLVIFGGERVLASDIERVRRVFSPRCEFFTGLGSTETGTIRHFVIGPDTVLDGRVVPVGYPVEGMEVLLLDDDGQPVPRGSVGEIVVRSRYVALGYWNLPEVSSRVFRTDPSQPEVRTYHTGDLGCLHPDGLLEHRGRRDFQVKIRGFRVEIADVEAALNDHAGIQEAVVVARESADQTQLVAYVVARSHARLRVRELRRFAAARVPYYMVPSLFVGLPAIPRTPNNKVDRLSLPPPGPDNELTGDEVTEPSTEIERELVAICRDLLRRETVGINQNFFELGGHSLSATQLVARVMQRFNVRLPMRAVFDAESLHCLSRLIADAGETSSSTRVSDLSRIPSGVRVPLSFAQRRMWLINQLYPGSAAYNISNSVRLQGPLDTDALEQAIRGIVARHEALRTVFPSDEQGPWQEVRPVTPFQLPRTDLRTLPPEEREERARQLAQTALQQAHDLANGPLFHSHLLQLGPDAHVLVLVFNHIIYDNIWSSGIFFRELGALYAAHTTRSAPALAPLEFQFGDYAHWQQAAARGPALQEDLAYWKHQLAGSPGPLEMPFDRARPAHPSFRGGQIHFRVPAEVRSALADFAAAESCTMFMVLLAAWQVTLHRYSHQDDIWVGTPTGRRHLAATEDMIGLFINTLVLRVDCSGNPVFRKLLQRVRTTTIDAFSHDDVPFEDLVAALRPERAPSIPPFFQNLFIHRNATQTPWTLPGLTVEPVEAHPGGAKFDLTLSILEGESLIQGTLEFSVDLYDKGTVERLLANYETLLASIVRNPNARLSELELISPVERRYLIEEVNQTVLPYPDPDGSDTVRMFEHRAAGQPDATAVITGGRRVTYRQINERANRIARELVRLGVVRDERVAVCLNRSPDLIAALLGVLKAGGAYVPMDPDFPVERLTDMIGDANALVFLSEPGIIDRFPELRARPLLLDEEAPVFTHQDPSNINLEVGRDDLAYVIYTSGSTGKPKGVQLRRQALTNFLLSMQREPGIHPEDVLHAITTVSFDIAALEIFLPLITGACVVMEPREVSLDPARLIASLQTTGATLLQATPVTWQLLLNHGWTGQPRVRVLCGGEAMGTDLAARLLSTGCEVWNLYGPTETTVWSTVQRVRKPGDAAFLGKPIANTQLYVASASLALQPIGAPGELLIGGDGLARGYHARDQLTAEKFIPHPFAASGRVYRTGDLVRRLPDGSVEFLGRMDHQVKLRGYRIELGEIEAQITAHDAVQHAVAVLREDTPGDKRLVAYLVPKPGVTPDADAVRTRLKARLPDYMVPSAFVSLESLPLTPNNKIDRKALPKPHDLSIPGPEGFEPPASATEALLASIYQELLGTARVGRRDNFFDLGGNSLMAVSVQARVARETGQRLELRTFFEASTLAGLAARIDGAGSRNVFRGSASGIPWIHVPGLYGVELLPPPLAEAIGRHCPYFDGLQFPGLDGDGELLEDIPAMAACMVRQIEALSPPEPLILSGFSFGGRVAIETARLLTASGRRVAMVVLFDTWQSGALRRRNLWQQARILSKRTRALPPGTRLRSLAQLARLKVSAGWPELLKALGLRRRDHRDALEAAAHMASVRYVPQIYPGRTVLLLATRLPPDDTARWERAEDSGWGPFRHPDFHIHPFDCDHASVFLEPVHPAVVEFVGQLASSVRR